MSEAAFTDSTTRFLPGGEGLAQLRQLDEDHIAKGFLGMVEMPTVTLPSASRRAHSWLWA